MPTSIVDVGCGIGYWVNAARSAGIKVAVGIDGADMSGEELLFPRDDFHHVDLGAPVDLGRRFDAALCLEVAEHLPRTSAGVLVDTLVRHSDFVVFSAACPGQRGQHHVNCQWPSWWQQLFNERGYVCDDGVRWTIWDNPRIEPWYRQNMFVARYDPALACSEERLKAVVSPYMVEFIGDRMSRAEVMSSLSQGSERFSWYANALWSAARAKIAWSTRSAFGGLRAW